MARPKKEKELKHHNQIMLRLTDIEYELISTSAQNAQLPLAEYARKQLMITEKHNATLFSNTMNIQINQSLMKTDG